MNIEKKKETIRIVKFFLFSISAGVIELSTFALLNELTKWTYWPCYLIALTISVLWNFTLNRNFTFQSVSNVPIAMIKIAIFYCIFTPATALLGNYLAEDLRWNEYLVTAINMALNLTTEYLYDRFFVFGKTIDTNNRAERNHINNKRRTRK